MAQRIDTIRANQTFLAVTLSLLITITVAIVLLFVGGSRDAWGTLIALPAVVLITVPILSHQAQREGSPAIFALLVTALFVKLLGSIIRHYVAFTVYEGVADAAGYHDWGVRIADRFHSGEFATGLDTLTGTDFIRFLTGLVYTAIGPSQLGGFLVFSWLGFLGLFFFYRAFTIAVPEGRSWSYAKLVFFLPSLLYWPSSIGKEAWMMFSLGIAAYGAARLLTGRHFRALVPVVLGLWCASLVRPHVAGLVGLALAAAYLLRRPDSSSRRLAPFIKVLTLAILVVGAAVLVVRTDRFLRSSNFETSDVTSVLEGVSERTQQGGSRFAPSILESPLRAPVAGVTVLFRPLLPDARSIPALASAMEGTFLLLLTLFRIRWALTALGSMRRQPYVAFAIAYGLMFVVAFSSVANFGLLARERVQLLPLFLVLLVIPPPDLRRPDDEASAPKDRLAEVGV